jgi:hypothetical protein
LASNFRCRYSKSDTGYEKFSQIVAAKQGVIPKRHLFVFYYPNPNSWLSPRETGLTPTEVLVKSFGGRIWLHWRRSSAVEQGTHKPLVAGSNPAVATHTGQNLKLGLWRNGSRK